MKIGISSIAYESKDLLNKCFSSWSEIKNNKDLAPEISDIKICFSHGCFEETYKLGFPIYSTDGTCELAKELKDKGVIDELIIYDSPQKENEMWTNNFLKLKEHDIDLLIMVNADEIWEVEKIQKLLRLVSENKSIDFFKINFKNFCINYSTWVDDFIAPRVWFVNKNDGLKRFYRDELVEYNNGKKDIECSHGVISKEYIFPNHYSWVGSKEYLQRKIHFQKLRYGQCSYEWSDENQSIQLNESYYIKNNLQKPQLKHD